MFVDDKFSTASGAVLYTDGYMFEEEDSALSIADYFNGNKLVAYILRSPSGRKYTATVLSDKNSESFVSHSEAENFLFSVL